MVDLNLPERDIRSCYYHIGRTSSQSIFFISDAIPITEKYIDGIHVGGNNQHYIIKNKNLISELEGNCSVSCPLKTPKITFSANI